MHAETRPSGRPDLPGRVRRVLEQSAAFDGLEPARRRRLANDMVEVLSYLADPVAGDESLRDLAETPDRPVMVSALQSDRASVSGRTGDKAAEVIGSFVKNVDFPQFVSSLIEGVFTSIVDASIKQMEAYQDLLANVVKSVNQFATDNFSDDDARNYVASSFPGRVHNSGGMLTMQDDDSGEIPDLGGLVGSSRKYDLHNDGDERALVRAAKLQMARLRQQQLSTMVELGLNRIVVTDGRINAKVVFDVKAKETARVSAEAASSSRDSTSTTNQKRKKSSWGSTNSAERTVTTNVSTHSSESESESNAKIEAKAKLTGEVQINFRSETFPLEKLAAPEQIGKLEQLQPGGTPAGGTTP